MTKLTLGAHPFLLGFDQLERLVERTAKTGNDGYPPYNIEQTSANSYPINKDLAGFRERALSITLEKRRCPGAPVSAPRDRSSAISALFRPRRGCGCGRGTDGKRALAHRSHAGRA